MNKQEAEKLMDEVWHKICKEGIPINIQTGTNMDVADWMKGILEKCIEIDEPLGTKMGIEYDICPKCGGVIGSSAYFCKRCGAYIRERVSR